MQDVEAKGIPVAVVAVKLPGEWIIRAIGPFEKYETLIEWIKPYVALQPVDAPLEWTRWTYRLPSYLVYDSGDLKGSGWPEAGVFVFRHRGDPDGGVYRDARKLRGGRT